MNASNSVPEGAVEDQPVSLLGRTRELAVSDLTIAKAIAGAPQTLIVGGDAGIGKTTLAAGVSAQARACGFTVATGHCLDIGADVPLAPLREALQEIVADRTDETLPAVTRRLTPFLWGHAEGDVVSADALSDLRFSLLELSRETPLMLVLEDMHWADRSTQDAAVMLSRTMKGPMVLLITYRAEDVTRHHPLRRTLAEIARSPGSSRLDLGPLDLPAIAGIVKATTGTDDLELATSILARSGGNPLFAEELAAGADVGVPEHLSALLLARIDALTPDTRAVIRLASVGGARITALLGAAADLPQGALDAPLREALDGNVLSAVATHLQFRHELVREAAYGDLLPDERVRAHLAFANALQARVDGEDSPGIADLSALAYHWSEAGDRTRAFVAHLRAGLMIHRFGAQSLTHLERVLELWSDVPDAEALGGIAKPEVLRLLAQAAKKHGDLEDADRYLRAALDAIDDDTDPLVASRVYSFYGGYHRAFDDRLGQPTALEMAVAIAEGTPSKELAMALATLSTSTDGSRSIDSSLALARRAVDVAVAADAGVEEAYARWALADSLWNLGQCRAAVSQYERAARVAVGAGASGLGLHIQADHACLLVCVGDITEAVAVADQGRARATGLGLPEVAALLGESQVEAYRDAGDLDKAEQLLEEIHAIGLQEDRWGTQQAALCLARGDLGAALPHVLEGIARADAGAHVHDFDLALQVDVLGALGRVDEVIARVHQTLSDRFHHESPLVLARAANTAFTALTFAASTGVAVPEGLREGAKGAVARAINDMSDDWSFTVEASQAMAAGAMARSLDGDPAVTEWRAASAAAATHGDYRALRPRLSFASALLESGDRAEAREVLLETWRSARTIGAHGVEEGAARVARRNRIPLPGLEELPPRLGALTPREREVIQLLATGATNRDIAQRLFISEKTASVHVSNILNKLRVPNRGAAAALARDLTN